MNRMEQAFWAFVRERHSIYLRRRAGQPPPWTEDPVLAKFKFCNVYRQLDRVTEALKERLKKVETGEDTLFHISMFRLFNWPPTYDALLPLVRRRPNVFPLATARGVVEDRMRAGHKVFTSAYMMGGGAPTGSRRYDIVLPSISDIWKHRRELTAQVRAWNTMEYATELMQQFPMVGTFIGYELACDFRHSSVMPAPIDAMTWANPGPGAARGLNRIYRGDPKGTPKGARQTFLDEMRGLAKQAPRALPTGWPKFEMREVEHSLCEFDKYLRGGGKELFTPDQRWD